MKPRATPKQVLDSLHTAQDLYQRLSDLREDILRRADAILEDWKPMMRPGEEMPFATNLAHYLAFRETDLSDLQPSLTMLGLSTLGRSEAKVLPMIDAVLAAVARIAGREERPFPAPSAFAVGEIELHDNVVRIFGEDHGGPGTRIMVTLPSEAAEDAGLVRRMIENGADCIRINCAHDTPGKWALMIDHARNESKKIGRDVRVLMDLAGPKIRIANVSTDEKVRFKVGSRFALTKSITGDREFVEATLSHDELIRELQPGVEVWINDGKIGARVVTREASRSILEVFHARPKGERLKAEKGVNLPGVDLDIPALTPEDITNLDFITAHADIVGYSFVQRPEDVSDLIEEIRKRDSGRPAKALMLKIETPLAIRNLPRLIVQAATQMPVAVMIARGDLAVEIGLVRLSEIQEEILWICEAAHVPVVWATQVLESMVKEGSASRAETTDAAMGQRAECVMLNKGPYLAEAVAFLDQILRRMDRHQMKKTARLGALRSWQS
jgi:pyruvate kinase